MSKKWCEMSDDEKGQVAKLTRDLLIAVAFIGFRKLLEPSLPSVEEIKAMLEEIEKEGEQKNGE